MTCRWPWSGSVVLWLPIAFATSGAETTEVAIPDSVNAAVYCHGQYIDGEMTLSLRNGAIWLNGYQVRPVPAATGAQETAEEKAKRRAIHRLRQLVERQGYSANVAANVIVSEFDPYVRNVIPSSTARRDPTRGTYSLEMRSGSVVMVNMSSRTGASADHGEPDLQALYDSDLAILLAGGLMIYPSVGTAIVVPVFDRLRAEVDLEWVKGNLILTSGEVQEYCSFFEAEHVGALQEITDTQHLP